MSVCVCDVATAKDNGLSSRYKLYKYIHTNCFVGCFFSECCKCNFSFG